MKTSSCPTLAFHLIDFVPFLGVKTFADQPNSLINRYFTYGVLIDI